MQSIPTKHGDTFSLAGTVTLPPGTWTAVSQVRDVKRTLIETLAVTLTPPVTPPSTGSWPFSILMVGDSIHALTWPIGRLFCDVRFIDNSTPPVVRTFPTFAIDVEMEQSDA